MPAALVRTRLAVTAGLLGSLASGVVWLASSNGCSAFGSASSPAPSDATDAGSPSPATDASDAPADAAGARWCQQQAPAPLLCADFDTLPFVAGWSTPEETGGGVINVDPLAYVSPPNSFVATTPTLAADALEPGRARLCNMFMRFPSEMHYALDVRLDRAGTGAAPVAVVDIEGPDVTLFLRVQVDGAGTWRFVHHLRASDGADSEVSGVDLWPQPAPGAWSRVRMDVVVTPDEAGAKTTSSVQVYVGDVLAVDRLVPAPVVQGNVRICAGLFYVTAPSAPWQVHFDNVRFDMRP